MKKILLSIGLIALSSKSWAQFNSGSISQFLSNAAKNARAGTSVDLKLHTAADLFVPYPVIHSEDGKQEFALLGLGADLGQGVSGTALHGAPLILPMVNLGAIPYILGKNNSISFHTTFPVLGNLEVGIGVLPLPVSGSHGKWVIGDQVRACLIYGF